jgi:hypothetical protein
VVDLDDTLLLPNETIANRNVSKEHCKHYGAQHRGLGISISLGFGSAQDSLSGFTELLERP